MAAVKQILPKYLQGYTYTSNDTEELIEVEIPIPQGTTKDDLTVQFNKTNSSVKAGITNEIPFIAGQCYETVKEFKYNIRPTSLVLKFYKETPQPWPFLIRGEIPAKKINQQKFWSYLDPQSAYILSMYHAHGGNEAGAVSLLLASAQTMFPPAVTSMANLTAQQQGDVGQLMPALFELVNKYKSGEAAATIGQLGITGAISLDVGMEYLRKGVELGDEKSTMYLGVLLSPLEEPHGPFENGSESIRILEKVVDMPRAKYSLARLYAAGVGCEQNKELAKKMYDEVKEEFPELPPINGLEQTPEPEVEPEHAHEEEKAQEEEKVPESGKTGFKKMLAVGGTMMLIGGTAAFALYRRLRRK